MDGDFDDSDQLIANPNEIAAGLAAASQPPPSLPTRPTMAMIDQNFTNSSLSLTLLFVLAMAVRQDLTEQRISNVLTLLGFATALAFQAISGGTSGFLNALAGAGVGMACLLPLYFGKGMGAGDVKLMGAAGAFLGPSGAIVAALLSLASGALLGLVVLVWRAVELKAATAPATGTVNGSIVAQLRKQRFPYAAAIAIGVGATMWWSGMLEVLIP